MQSISRKEVADLVGLEIMAELHQICEKKEFFERKYKGSYDQALFVCGKKDENFEVDDDLMEWKAYIKLEEDRRTRLEDIRHERFQIA
jgi:hypothetical protein